MNFSTLSGGLLFFFFSFFLAVSFFLLLFDCLFVLVWVSFGAILFVFFLFIGLFVFFFFFFFFFFRAVLHPGPQLPTFLFPEPPSSSFARVAEESF